MLSLKAIRAILPEMQSGKRYDEAIAMLADARDEVKRELEVSEEYLRRMVDLQRKYNEFKS